MTQAKTRLLITVALSLGLGILAIVPVVNSFNGYVAGYVYFPFLLLITVSCVIIFLIGFAFLLRVNALGLYFLAAMVLLSAGFFGSALIAKQFELGAYREEPMLPITPSVANKVVFKKDATDEDEQKFWREILSVPASASGEQTRPGIQSIGSSPPEDGHEVVLFSFFADATDDQKSDIRERIESYPPVLRYQENIDTTTPETPTSGQENTVQPEKKVPHSQTSLSTGGDL